MDNWALNQQSNEAIVIAKASATGISPWFREDCVCTHIVQTTSYTNILCHVTVAVIVIREMIVAVFAQVY